MKTAEMKKMIIANVKNLNLPEPERTERGIWRYAAKDAQTIFDYHIKNYDKLRDNNFYVVGHLKSFNNNILNSISVRLEFLKINEKSDYSYMTWATKEERESEKKSQIREDTLFIYTWINLYNQFVEMMKNTFSKEVYEYIVDINIAHVE